MKHLAKRTLESFIDEYVKRKILDGGAKSYGEYISTMLPDKSKAYQNAHTAVIKSAISQGTSYGRLGERLAKSGLSRSGYSDYLKNRSAKAAENSIRGIRADYEASGATESSAYGEYLKKLGEEGNSIYESAAKKLKSAHLIDYEKAYSMALDLGLKGEIAEELAESAVSEERETVKEDVISKMLEKGFSELQTYRYALSRGLSSADAKELKLIARRLNETVDDSEEALTFLDYLREKSQNNKQKG